MGIQACINALGGADELRITGTHVGRPGPGEIRLRQTAIGVNFVDIYHRTGLYPLRQLPAVLGMEGIGIIEEVGEGVQDLVPGDRITYLDTQVGAYASERLLAASRAVRAPAAIDDDTLASSVLRGLTVHMLLTRTYEVKPDDVVLVHAAAGGLGQMLTRWAKRLGATVIACVGSDAKIPVASEAGADHVVLRGREDLEQAVKALSDGKGAHLVIDGVGGSTLARSLGCVRPFGVVASIGQTDGPIPPLSVMDIGPRRSASLARPSVIAYAADDDVYRAAAAAYLDELARGLGTGDCTRYPLKEVASAHRDMEAGTTTGRLVLIP